MGDNVPLLNEYKREFFWKRFSQTLLGGPKLRLGFQAPAYVYINQVILFIIPLVLGGIFSILVELAGVSVIIGYCVFGGCMGLYVFCAQLTSFLVQRKSVSSVRPNIRNILSEEDEVEFESCFGSETLNFILPVKKWKVNILFHAIASGVMCGLGFLYLIPTTLNALYSNTVAATVIIYTLGWMTLCIAQYPLTVTSPPELAIFRATDAYEITLLTRPFHVCLFCAADLVWRSYPDIVLLNQILHIVFIFLPLLWVIGLLPSIDALLLWLGEQILVSVFGGSPVATDLRLLLMLVVSGVTLVVAYFLPSTITVIVFSACIGYLLSLNLGDLCNQLIDWCKSKQRNRLQVLHSQSEPPSKPGLGWRWGWKEALVHFVTTLVIGGISFVCSFYSNSANVTVFNILGYGMIGLRFLLKILGDVQSVYVFFGLWRNKLFPESVQNMSAYTKRKRTLHRVSFVYRILLRAVSPLWAMAYLGLFLSTSSLPSFLFALGSVRSLRCIWQDTPRALLELSVVHIINTVLTLDPTSWWVTAGLGIQHLLVAAILDRLIQLMDKLYCFVVILITSYSIEKQRRSSSMPLIIVSIILLPFIFVVIVVATILSAPLLPLFTLPIFLIGFPRPLRSWPGVVGASANPCSDSVYYKQLAPKLCTALSRHRCLGTAKAGSHYLVRFQDRMAWLQVLETGYGFCTISIKGMELQETSCHTVEAAQLDDIFETTFERSGGFPVCTFNKFPLHTLTAVDAVPVDTYSDARNVLTGIIDSPDVLRSIDKCFIQTLLWVFLYHNSQKHRDSSTSARSPTHVRIQEPTQARQDDGTKMSQPTLLAEVTKISGNWESRDSGRPSSVHSRPRSQVKPLSASWDSIKSWEDNDSLDFDLEDKPKKTAFNLNSRTKDSQRHKESPAIPGVLEGFTDDEEEILKELNFGLPPVNAINANIGQPQTFAMHSMQHKPLTLTGSVQFTSTHSSKLSLPLKWRHLPIDLSRITSLFGRFPKDWYSHVLQHMDLAQDGKSSKEVADEITSDDALTSMYMHLTMACYAVVNVFGLSGLDLVSAGASHVYKVYSGDVPWSSHLDWLKEDEELYTLVIKAYRFAFKLAYDQAVLGEADDFDEISEYIQQYNTEYYFGRDNDPEWAESVQQGIPQLFSLLHDSSEGVYKSRVLTRQPVMANIGRLNPEVVRSLWASLNLELLYFTNDDEERYSIQAHPTVLRNLTVQAADPPLGYPIYASPPMTIPTL
ncbi:pecanex-like protein 4 isoform X1 [Asterias amurensis]|uniref:pecanex-like protein 4 isoform X1 n=1 Tax=Asterias amurensis TaxID=7602 RepID=UPI003AB580EC